ncbi:MAG TPA: hypothetical protein PKW35_06495 [Nannocystaceae bacterium]|nr:hypothetical protein [Nannocystaceae bacterium]
MYIIAAISGDGCRPVVYAVHEALSQMANVALAEETADTEFPDDFDEE